MLDVNLQRDWVDAVTLIVAFWGAASTVTAAIVAVRVAGADARDRRRHQATQVSAWMHWTSDPQRPQGEPLGPAQPHVVISNGSASSVYEVVITWGAVQGAGEAYRMPADGVPVCIAKVPPGEWLAPAPYYAGGGMHLVTDAAVSFIDSAGRFWRRDAPGRLERTKRSPLDDLRVSRPLSYSRIERFSGQ